MLKKVVYLSCIFICLLSFSFLNFTPLFSKYSKCYELYLKSNSSSAKILRVSQDNYPFVWGIKGESCKIHNENFDVNKFFTEMNAKYLFCEYTEDVISYYAFSEDVKYCQIVNGEKVNLHVAISQRGITIGSPIIYGSF